MALGAGSTVLAVGPFPFWAQVPALVVVFATFVLVQTYGDHHTRYLFGLIVGVGPFILAYVATEEWEKATMSRSSTLTSGRVGTCVWTPVDYAGLVTYEVDGHPRTVLATIDRGWSSCPDYVAVEYADGRPLISRTRSDVIVVPGSGELRQLIGPPARGR